MNTDIFKEKKVFVSYVRENSDQINEICKAFDQREIEYWLDRDKIEPGKYWEDAIIEAINNGTYFLACFSKESEEKSTTFMREEILLAIDILKKKPYNSGWFIPIKLSKCEIPNYPIGAGRTLQNIHYLELYQNWNDEIKKLLDIVKSNYSEKIWEKIYYYKGLKALIESGDGTGFHNRDLGHPVYVLGSTGKEYNEDWGDSPERNTLFKIISALSKDLKSLGIDSEGYIWWYDFSEWKDFCKFAVDIYNRECEIK